uniref:hypothetical protein n=1 Tax=Sandarakinorhabdus sp. TaxID=1916663 RepID=UPI00286E178A
MSFRIGFVSSSGNPATALDVQSLLPPDTQLDVMSIDEATQQVAEGAVVLLILAMDGADWRADLRFIDNLHLVGEKRPLAVLALVPGADPEALAIAFEYNVADVAGLPVNPHE